MSLLPHDAALAAVTAAHVAGDRFGELFAEDHTKLMIDIGHEGEVRSSRPRRERGMGLRRVTGGPVRYRYVDALDPAALTGLAAAVRDGSVPRGGARGDVGGESDVDACVRLGRLALAAVGDGVRARVRVVSGVQHVLVARADAGVLEESRRYAAVHVHVVARSGSQVRSVRRSAGGVDLASLEGRLDVGAQAREAALAGLDAVPAPTGTMRVILGPGSPAMLLHEACGHALEADVAGWDGAAYAGLTGEAVASPLVTLLDDPGAPAAAPLYTVDDEGSPAAPVALIEAGVLTGRLRDRAHGGRGHGRRLTYAYPPLPRMAGTVVAPGPHDPEEIVADTMSGIYVAAIGGGDTDLASGRFRLRVDEGFLVENGRITAPIRPGVLSGRGSEVLAAVDRVGTDLRVLGHTYLCRKLDQFPLVVNLGQPTLRVAAISVREG